jgi:hypothetical protein
MVVATETQTMARRFAMPGAPMSDGLGQQVMGPMLVLPGLVCSSIDQVVRQAVDARVSRKVRAM